MPILQCWVKSVTQGMVLLNTEKDILPWKGAILGTETYKIPISSSAL